MSDLNFFPITTDRKSGEARNRPEIYKLAANSPNESLSALLTLNMRLRHCRGRASPVPFYGSKIHTKMASINDTFHDIRFFVLYR
jgi:hypothetical protein